MATIERKPLPPPNSTAVAIAETDRAEMMARANAVIDYYLNGPGSFWDAGPRKPLVSEDERAESTFNDLKKFKDRVIASKQFADDPNSIMDSIIALIDKTGSQVQEAARRNEGIDGISRLPPNTSDPIDDPRVISPRILRNGALNVALPRQEPATSGGEMGTIAADARPICVLSSRVVPRGGNLVGSISLPDIPDRPVAPSEASRPVGLFTSEPMPQWPVPPPIWDFPDHSGDSGASQNSNGSSIPMLEEYIRYLNRANSA